MRRRRTSASRAGAGYDESWRLPLSDAFGMSRKYELVRDKIALPGGGFVEAVRMALVDLSCFGEGRRLDLTGYPHESEAAALASDWKALGVDIRKATRRVLTEASKGDSRVGATSSPRKPG